MTLTAHLPILQVIVPMLTAPLVVLLRVRGLPWLAATAASVVAFCTAVALTIGVLPGGDISYTLGGWQAPFGIELRVDAFNALVLLIITGASTAALLAARRSIDAQVEQERQPLFYAAWLLALSGLAGIAATGDAFNIFVFMEISSLASYVLIAGGPDRRALVAVYKYLVMGTTGATFYLIGVGLIYMMTGTLNMEDMASRVSEFGDLRPVLLGAGFITVGLALKAAVFPLHVWLPNAYTWAPHAVTVFIAACGTKVALYVLFRFDFIVFQGNLAGHDLQFSSFLMPLAVLAILVASAVALFERNVKRLLAFSSVAQIGYIVLGASLVSASGLTAGILHMFNHALAKGALFLAVACLGLRLARLGLDDVSGIARRMPLTFGAFVLAGLSLVGVPGTAGFVSKWYLIVALMEHDSLRVLLIASVLVSSLMALAYLWRVVEVAWFGEPSAAARKAKEAPAWMLMVTWAVVLANIWFGFDPELPVTLSSSAAEMLMGPAP